MIALLPGAVVYALATPTEHRTVKIEDRIALSDSGCDVVRKGYCVLADAISFPVSYPEYIWEDSPIVPRRVKTEIFRKPEQRSEAPQGRIQLASVAPTEIPAETKSATIRTPFGVNITMRRSLAAPHPELSAFLRRVSEQCGQVTIVSTHRPGAKVAGTNRTSCHSANQAVDYQIANHSCALRVARGVRLGHSIDYVRVNHFHVSNCRGEMGARFAHGGGRARATRYARSRHHRRGARVAHYQRAPAQHRPLWTSG